MKTITRTTLLVMLLAAALSGCERPAGEESGPDEAAGHEHTEHAEHMKHGGSAPDDVPEDQSRRGPSEHGDFFVTVTPEPNPIPFQELFELEVKVFESEAAKTPVEAANLDEVRATMPAHDHAMKTAPEVIKEGPGHFRVKGMKFHMQGAGEDGRWVIDLTVNADGTIDTAKFDVQCCSSR